MPLHGGRTLIDVGSSFIVVQAPSTFIQTTVTVTSLDDVILDHWSEHMLALMGMLLLRV